METSSDHPGSLVLGEGAGPHTERLEQRSRSIWELEGKTRRRPIEEKGNQKLCRDTWMWLGGSPRTRRVF